MQPLNTEIGTNRLSKGRGGADLRLGSVKSRAMRRLLKSSGLIFVGNLLSNRLVQTGLVGSVLLAGVALFPPAHVEKGKPLASLSSLAGFKPTSLVVKGNDYVDGKMIEAALHTQIGSSLFAFDADAARDILLKNPWLKSASVSKVYPNTIRVDMVERQPFAFWKSEETVRVIARDGVALGEAAPQHMRLPQVVGAGANLAAPEFIATITRFPELAERSKGFVRVASRRWNLALRNKVTVLLPEHGWRDALLELDHLHETQGILDRAVTKIDMRLPDRLVLQLDESVAQERRERLDDLLKRKWHRT